MKAKVIFKDRELQWYTLIFILFAIVIILPFAVKDVTLVDNWRDGYQQYFPAYVYMGEYIRNLLHGSFNLWDLSIGYGEDVIETLNYYGFGDPLNFFAVFGIGKASIYLFGLFIFVRMYLAGVGMILFLRHRQYSGLLVSLGGILYAFQLWAIYKGPTWYIFLNSMYLFPFLVMQTEKVSKENTISKNGIFFTLLLGIQGCSGFYFLYSQTVLLIVYWLVICDHENSISVFFRQAKNLALCYIVGVLLSAIYFLPSIHGFFNSSRGFSQESSEKWQLLVDMGSIRELIAHFMIPSVNEENKSLALPVICIFAVIGGLLTKYYLSKREVLMTIFVSTLLISPAVTRILNGFSYAVDRWKYVVYFWLIYITIVVLARCKERPISKVAIVIAACASLVSIGGYYKIFRDTVRFSVWLLILFATVFALWKNKDKWISATIGINVLLILFFLNIPQQGTITQLTQIFASRENIEELFFDDIDHSEWSRIDVTGGTPGESLITGQAGTESYYSVMNGNIYDFYDKFRISTGLFLNYTHWAQRLDNRKPLQYILSVGTWEEDGVLYRDDPLPIGFWYEKAMSESQFESVPVVDRQALVLDAVVIADDTVEEYKEYDVADAIPYTVTYYDAEYENGVINTGENPSIILHFERDIQGDGQIYVALHGLHAINSSRQINDILVNEGRISGLTREEYLVNIGVCDEAIITLEANSTFALDSIDVYWSDLSEAEQKVDQFRNHALKNVEYSNWKITGTSAEQAQGWAFFSIPYSNNWRAYVDGKPVDTIRADIGFTAVKVDAGEHVVTLKYCPIWFYIGAVCSFFAIIVCVIWFIIWFRKRNDIRNNY